jgi:hypothetical protein
LFVVSVALEPAAEVAEISESTRRCFTGTCEKPFVAEFGAISTGFGTVTWIV